MWLWKLPFYGAAVVSTWVIRHVVFRGELYEPEWEKVWKQVEEYWDLVELIGADFFDQIPIDEQKRLEKRYYYLTDEVGKYADVARKPKDFEKYRKGRKRFAEEVQQNKMMGRHSIWPMATRDHGVGPRWSQRIRRV